MSDAKREAFVAWAALLPVDPSELDASLKRLDGKTMAERYGDSLMHKNPIFRGFSYNPNLFGAVPGTEAFEELGGAEGLTGLIQLNSMDKDGDGEISREEIENAASRSRESYSNMLLNMGVIGALCLSITIPFGVGGLEMRLGTMAKELQPLEQLLENFEYQGISGVWYQFFFEYAALLIFMFYTLKSIQSSLSAVVHSVRIYTQLSFWMPTADLQLEYIDKVDIRPLIFIQQDSVYYLSQMVLVGCALKVSVVASIFYYYLAKEALKQYEKAMLNNELICCFSMHAFAHKLMAQKASSSITGNSKVTVSSKAAIFASTPVATTAEQGSLL